MTTNQTSITELLTPPSVIDYVSLFGSPDLQQQAKKVENAATKFCKTTFDHLRTLGNIAIDLTNKCTEELGEEQGKATFNNWLGSDGFGASRYVLRVAMKIAARYPDLKPRLQKLARDNVQFWGLHALEDLFGVADDLFELMIKRGKRSHKAIKKVDDTMEGRQPNLPRGGYVEVIVDDNRQLQGEIGKVIDKDEYGKIIVKLPNRPEVVLEQKDLTKQTPKAVADYAFKEIESVTERYDFLQEECLQKDQLIREYELAAVSNKTSEPVIQAQIAQAIAAYKQSQAEKEAALYEELKTAALAEASAKIEASNQIIQRLTQQLENKERLAQEVAELQQQLELQNQEILRAQQLKEERQKLEQQVVKLRERLRQTAGNLASDNQEIVKVDNNLDNQPNYRDNSSIIAASQRDDNTKEILSQPFLLLNKQKQEGNEYQVEQRENLTTQREVAELKKQLEISQRTNTEVVEANEILLEAMKAFRVESGRKKVKQSMLAMEMNLSNNNNRGNLTAPKPEGFKIRTSSR